MKELGQEKVLVALGAFVGSQRMERNLRNFWVTLAKFNPCLYPHPASLLMNVLIIQCINTYVILIPHQRYSLIANPHYIPIQMLFTQFLSLLPS
jgi:hypothetical protein